MVCRTRAYMNAISASAQDGQTDSAQKGETLDAGPLASADQSPLIDEYEQALEKGVSPSSRSSKPPSGDARHRAAAATRRSMHAPGFIAVPRRSRLLALVGRR